MKRRGFVNTLILASKSPRRRELIKLITDDVICTESGAQEILPEVINPSEVAEYLSCLKATSVKKNYPDNVVVGSDTVVILEDEILTKPKDEEDAKRILSLLSGKSHRVITACTLAKGEKVRSFSSVTEVEFYPLTSEEIEQYVKSGEPMDKAGAYGIQGGAALFVREIRGDYLTVVGLPVARLKRELEAFLSELQG